MAQPGSALPWGGRGRWFKSSRSDQLILQPKRKGPTGIGYTLETELGIRENKLIHLFSNISEIEL